MPKVSIIIPAYNCEDFILETIESILSQTYKDYEIIVVNDGSTDRTAEILQRYGNKIRYIYQPNGGTCKAVNTGILNAKGDYIAFIDHDDGWLPDKLSLQVSLLEKNRTLGLVYSDAYLLKNESFASPTAQSIRAFCQWGSPRRGKIFQDLFLNNFIVSSSVVVRKECFEKVGMFQTSAQPVEDYDRWLRIAANYEIDYIDKPLAKYRTHDRCHSKDSVVDTEARIRVTTGILNSYHVDKKIANRQLFLLYYSLAKAYLYRVELQPARENFLLALRFGYSFKTWLLYIFTFIGKKNILAIKKTLSLFRKKSSCK